MCNRLKEPGLQIGLGLVFLVIASLFKWLLQPGSGLANQWTDGAIGLLYGVSIGFMLSGIWKKSRQGPA